MIGKVSILFRLNTIHEFTDYNNNSQSIKVSENKLNEAYTNFFSKKNGGEYFIKNYFPGEYFIITVL